MRISTRSSARRRSSTRPIPILRRTSRGTEPRSGAPTRASALSSILTTGLLTFDDLNSRLVSCDVCAHGKGLGEGTHSLDRSTHRVERTDPARPRTWPVPQTPTFRMDLDVRYRLRRRAHRDRRISLEVRPPRRDELRRDRDARDVPSLHRSPSEDQYRQKRLRVDNATRAGWRRGPV